jgi:prevent-host-death family protein
MIDDMKGWEMVTCECTSVKSSRIVKQSTFIIQDLFRIASIILGAEGCPHRRGRENAACLADLFMVRYSDRRKSMKISEDIRPVTYLKSKAADMLQQINETHRPVIITQNGEPRAVLQDPESYERMKSAIGLMKLLAQGEEDIRKGRTTEQEEMFKRLESRLKAGKHRKADES